MKRLVHLGVDLNIPNSSGRTWLYEVFFSGDLDFAHFLFEQGAKLENSGISPISLILGRKDFGGQSPKYVEWLIEHGANIDDDTNNGFTALEIAIKYGWESHAIYLINKGANLNPKRSRNGMSLAEQAVGQGLFQAARLLINKGVPYNSRLQGPGLYYVQQYKFRFHYI